MTRPEQKQDERRCLEQLLELMELQVKNIQENESPDLTFEMDNRRIAVEVTDYYARKPAAPGRPLQEVEEAWAELLSLITRNYSGLNGWVGYIRLKQPAGYPQKSRWQPFIAALRVEAEEAIDGAKEDEVSFQPTSPHLAEYIERIRLSRRTGIIDWATNLGAGSVGLDDDSLISRIEAKLLHSHAKGFNESWLLICTGLELSQNPGRVFLHRLNLNTRLNALLASSTFDKVYLYVRRHSRILEWDRETGWKVVKGDPY